MPMEYQPDPFLRDSWSKKVDAERGAESSEDTANKIFNQIESNAIHEKELTQIFEAVKKDILRYRSTIERLKQFGNGGSSTKEIEEADQVRRMAHNRMVDDINLLSRQFRSKGMDNSWRREIGDTNEKIGSWVERLKNI